MTRPPLILIHGLGGSARVWDRVAPLLEARFEVTRFDLPGFGDAAGPPGSIEAMARAALARVTAEAPVIAGHSMGGLVATAAAELAPDLVSRLVIVNSPPTVESRMAARGPAERILRMRVLGDLAWRRASDDRLRAGMRSAFAPGHEVPDLFVEDLRRAGRESYLAGNAAINRYLARRTLPERLAALTQQVMVVFGERDGRVDPRSLDLYGPVGNVTVATIPEAGHSSIWEAPDRVAELVAAGAGVTA